MKSLFLRIFLSFWMAQALFVVLAILVTLALRPRTSTWEALRTTVLTEAVAAYEEGNEAQLREYMDTLEKSQHVRAYLFDERGTEVSGRGAPDWAMRVAAGGPRTPRDGFLIPAPPVQRDSRASSDGKHRYTLVLRLPPGPRVFFGPRGLPVPGLIIAIISSGLMCYLLSWYLTKPIVRLRAATRQLAAGDLTARSGAPAGERRDEVAGLMRDFDAMAERMESLVKEMNYRVKGTEMWWNDPDGAEAILQIRAAGLSEDHRLARHLDTRLGSPFTRPPKAPRLATEKIKS